MRWSARAGLLAAVLLVLMVAACTRTEPPADTASTAAPAAVDQADDARLTTAVQAKYYTDGALRGRRIDVAAENGVVTLSGTVPTEAARERAIGLARDVEGVTSVNDQLNIADSTAAQAPSPTEAAPPTTGTAGRRDAERPPSWITTKIQAQYFANPDIKPWNIEVTTTAGGVVTLDGVVEDQSDKAEAVRIARETEGVTRVDDRLRTKSQPSEAAGTGAGPSSAETARTEDAGLSDEWLTAKIQAKYFVDEEVKARNIDVDTSNRAVTLKGTVASEAERRQALAIARNTDGVREVTDELRVDANAAAAAADDERQEPLPDVQPVPRPDAWITMKIQAQYFLDAEVKGHEIDVDTREGVVTLKGTVETTQQKQEAEQIARETAGVKRVLNQLTVAAAGSR